MAKNPYTPKTREEFEAYARAMDAANEGVVKAAGERKGVFPKMPEKTAKAPAKKPGTKAAAKKTGKK